MAVLKKSRTFAANFKAMKRPQMTEGNDWRAIVPLFFVSADGARVPLDVALIDDLDVKVLNNCGKEVEGVEFVGVENKIIIDIPKTLASGSYSVEITGTVAEGGMRYAHRYGFDIVAWSEQSNIDGVVSGLDVPLEDALFVLVADDGDIATLEEQLRQAIAAAEAARDEYVRKVEALDDVASETKATLNREAILAAISRIPQGATSAEVQAIIDRLKADLQGSDDTVTLTTLKELITALSPVVNAATAYNEGKPALAAAITAKGQATEPTASLAQMAEKVGLIQQETYELQGNELYEKQMFGAATDVSDPYVQDGSPLWNLYAVMAALKSDGRFINYGGILLAEYFKGYDSIELINAGAGGAYYTCDGDFYTTDRGTSNPHIWHDGDNGKMNRWVAYLFAAEGTNYTIPSTNLCPRSIHIGRKVGTIVCESEGRISEIVVTDGNELYCTNFTSTQVWQKNVVIHNIKQHSQGFIMNGNSNVVSFQLDAKTITSLPISYQNNSNLSAIIIDECEEYIDDSTQTPLVKENVVYFSAKKLRKLYKNSAFNTIDAFIIRSLLKKVELPSLEEFNCYAYGKIVADMPYLEELLLPKLSKISSIGIAGYYKVTGAELPLLRRIQFGTLTSIVTDMLLYLLSLEDVEVGEGTNINLAWKGWNPTNVIADPTKLATLNENIRNHIAAKVNDRTGQSALTFTVSTNLYNNLEQATKDAFTAKNWNVAGA